MSKKLFIIWIFGLSWCFAQADRAALTGTITDATRAGVPGAHVKVVYPDTGLSRETVSSSSGVFRLSGLPIGACHVEVTATGFRTAKTEAIVLSVAETRELDLTLELGSIESTVEVRGVTEALVQNNAAVGDVLVASQLDNLPVNGRDWKALMSLVPGAVDGQKFFATGGDDVNFHVDGVDASGVRDQNMKVHTRDVMSQDAVAEFRVSTALYSADTGGTAGGQVQIVTKSGSNAFHGSAFEYFRNNVFDARSPFDPAKHPSFRLNQFGSTLGGPVIKNKTFFFVSYEGFRQALQTSLIGYVPTPLLRSQVQATSPVLAPFVNAYPLPNAGLLSSQVGQWTGQGSNSENEDVGTIRVDHRFSDRLAAYFRFTRNNNRLSTPSSLGEPNPQVIAPTSGVLGFQFILSPRTTNELRFGGNFIPWDALSPTQLPVSINPGGGLSSPAAYSIQVWHALSESIVDNFTAVRGNHTWKAGVEIRRPVLSLWATPGYSVGYASISDFAPRVSLAWAPAAFHEKTVIRVGGGKFFGDAQLGDQQAAVTNDGFSYSLTSATTPTLAFPVIVDPNNLPRTAPTDYNRHRKSENFQEWGVQVQQILPAGFTGARISRQRTVRLQAGRRPQAYRAGPDRADRAQAYSPAAAGRNEPACDFHRTQSAAPHHTQGIVLADGVCGPPAESEGSSMSNAIQVIFPYRSNRVWMFDDAAKGLYREPFVCGIPEMLAALVTGIAEPYLGFALYFSDQEFPGFQFKVDLVEAEAGGNWYKMTVDGTEMKGWLCPALFKYFEAAPTSIYAKAEAMDRGPTPTAHGSFWQRLWSKL